MAALAQPSRESLRCREGSRKPWPKATGVRWRIFSSHSTRELGSWLKFKNPDKANEDSGF